MLEDFGIKVQVASPDDWVLALDGITLANLKNIKKNATKADMEELVAYKRGKHSKAVAAEREEEERTEEETLDTLCEKADEIKELVVSEFSKRLEELSTIAEEKGITTFGFTGGYIEYPYEDEFDSEEEYEEANETYETFFDSKMNFIWVNDNNFKLYDGLSFVISNGYVNFTSVIELDGWDNEEYFEDEDSEWMFDPNLYDNWTKCSKIIRAIEIELGIE